MEPGYGGSGCPAGSASIAIAPDSSVLQILFDAMVAETGTSLNRRIDRKQCTVVLPIYKEPGFQFTVVIAQARGFLALETGAQARVSQTVRIPNGLNGKPFEKKWTGPMMMEFILDNSLSSEPQLWSLCGQTQSLVQISYVAQVVGGKDNVHSLVQLSPEGIIRLQWRRCKS